MSWQCYDHIITGYDTLCQMLWHGSDRVITCYDAGYQVLPYFICSMSWAANSNMYWENFNIYIYILKDMYFILNTNSSWLSYSANKKSKKKNDYPVIPFVFFLKLWESYPDLSWISQQECPSECLVSKSTAQEHTNLHICHILNLCCR